MILQSLSSQRFFLLYSVCSRISMSKFIFFINFVWFEALSCSQGDKFHRCDVQSADELNVFRKFSFFSTSMRWENGDDFLLLTQFH